MSITANQIKFYKSLYVNDALTNGGRIGESLIADNSMSNLFRNIQSDERISGITLYRKFFIKNDNPNDLGLENPKLYIGNISSGEDYFQLSIGTDTDNQSAADDYTDWYGSGVLTQNTVSGETSFSVECKIASGFPDDCLVMISDGLQRELIRSVGSPIWTNNVAAIELEVPFSFDFSKEETVVSAVIEFNEITPTVTDWLEDSTDGTYDETTYPITVYNIGAIVESWLLTFTSATSFTVEGAITGSLGSGSILSNFIPANGAGYYFNLSYLGWNGSWVAGDTISFKTTHAAQGIWVKEIVPSNAVSQSMNVIEVKLIGESN